MLAYFDCGLLDIPSNAAHWRLGINTETETETEVISNVYMYLVVVKVWNSPRIYALRLPSEILVQRGL
jgi:hypothetical protein